MERDAANDRLRAYLKAGAGIAGPVAGTALGLYLGNPAGALAGVALGEVAAITLQNMAIDFSSRMLSQREGERTGSVFRPLYGQLRFAANELQHQFRYGIAHVHSPLQYENRTPGIRPESSSATKRSVTSAVYVVN